MGTHLDVASRQLFSRSDDECFPDWRELLRYLEGRERDTRELEVHQGVLRTVAEADELKLAIGQNIHALTDWGFRSVCDLSRAPASFINRLPAPTAALVLNETRALFGDNQDQARVLTLATFPEPVARAIYSPSYARVPDLTVARLVHEEISGFVPAGTLAGGRKGMPRLKPQASGLYASDRDIFLFLADEEHPVEWKPKGNGGGAAALYRFLIVRNSETTTRQIGLIMGLYEFICGNHIIWNAEEVVVWERRHVGDPEAILEYLRKSIEALRDRGTIKKELAVLQAAAETSFAGTKEDFIEKLYPDVTKALAAQAWDSAIMDFDAHVPLSVWNTVQGLTRVSQNIGYMDRRMEVDQVAGKLLAQVKP
jgi:hypothetical protein